MAIKLISGLPGAGKSLSLVDEACKLKEQAERAHSSPRAIYAVGIDGLKPEIATTLDDPKDWQSLPDGSIILVDEAWKYFSGGAPGAKNPDYISGLAEHRHRGFDFIMATQHPSQIGKFTRDLIGAHVHLKRRFGTHRIARVEWQEVVTDLQSESKKKLGIKSEWVLPAKRFPLFVSATLHTVKRKIPLRAMALPAIVLLVPLLGWFAYHRMHAFYGSHDPATSSGASASQGQAGGFDGAQAEHVVTPAEWVKARTPRVAGIPWSAPVWDKLEVTTVPDMICVLSERDDGASNCHCYTEQVTPIDDVDQKICYKAAKQGIYNPYRRSLAVDSRHERQDQVRSTPESSPAGNAPTGSNNGGISQVFTPPELMAHLPDTQGYVRAK